MKTILAYVASSLKKSFGLLQVMLKEISIITADARDLIDAALGLAAVVAVILIIRGCHACSVPPVSHSPSPRVIVPQDTNFTTIINVPVKSSQLKKSGAKIPKNVKPSNVNKVVQIALKTGDTLQVVIASEAKQSPELRGGSTPDLSIFVAKDSMISSVRVLDVQPPSWHIGLFPGAGVSVSPSLPITPSPSLALALLKIGKYRLPLLSADLTGLGLGAGYQVLPNIMISASYFALFTGDRAIKAGIYYEF